MLRLPPRLCSHLTSSEAHLPVRLSRQLKLPGHLACQLTRKLPQRASAFGASLIDAPVFCGFPVLVCSVIQRAGALPEPEPPREEGFGFGASVLVGGSGSGVGASVVGAGSGSGVGASMIGGGSAGSFF